MVLTSQEPVFTQVGHTDSQINGTWGCVYIPVYMDTCVNHYLLFLLPKCRGCAVPVCGCMLFHVWSHMAVGGVHVCASIARGQNHSSFLFHLTHWDRSLKQTQNSLIWVVSLASSLWGFCLHLLRLELHAACHTHPAFTQVSGIQTLALMLM